MPYIEQGERDFSFRFAFGSGDEIAALSARTAQAFNMQPMLLSFYPTGLGTLPECPLQLCDTQVIQLTTFKKAENNEDYLIRLFNPTDQTQTAKVVFKGTALELCFNKYEIKTVRCKDSELFETNLCV